MTTPQRSLSRCNRGLTQKHRGKRCSLRRVGGRGPAGGASLDDRARGIRFRLMAHAAFPVPPEKLPFLVAISWFDERPWELSPREMLSRYEAGWKYHGVLGRLQGDELKFVRALVSELGSTIELPEA